MRQGRYASTVTRQARGWEVLPGEAGWAGFNEQSPRRGWILVRFRLQGNRLVATDLHLHDATGIGTDHLRQIPLGQIEAIANTDPHRHRLMRWIDKTPRRLPIDNVVKVSEKPIKDWHEALAEAWGSADMADQIMLGAAAIQDRETIARMSVPDSRPYPQSFYEQVAETYGKLTASGSRRPAQEIADASGVPVSTVHRWVKEARRLQLLPEGQRGKLA